MHPRSVAHIGVTVPDLQEAIDWYREILGWTLLTEPRTVVGNEGFGGERAVDVLGDFEEMRVANLVTGNQVGVELFEFTPSSRSDDVDPKEPGIFHLCVVDPDVEGLADSIDASGGQHYSKIWRLHEDNEEYKLTYCKDPFGNLIEIYSHNQEQMNNPLPPSN